MRANEIDISVYYYTCEVKFIFSAKQFLNVLFRDYNIDITELVYRIKCFAIV